MAEKDFLDALGTATVDEVSIEAVIEYVRGQVEAYTFMGDILTDNPNMQTLDRPGIYRQVASDVSEVLEVLESLTTRYGVYDKLFGALHTVEAMKEAE
jgi:hypothetical protein